MRKGRLMVCAVVIMAAVAAVYILGGDTRQPDFTVFSAGEEGVSLLYDTLRAMHYPVSPSYRPIDNRTNPNDVYLIIQPDAMDAENLAAILAWVRRGGRLIYFEDGYPTLMDEALTEYDLEYLGGMWYFTVGLGEVAVGNPYDITNYTLMSYSYYGLVVEYILSEWNADHVYFAEYYHGYAQADSLLSGLPVGFKLAFCQVLLGLAAVVWMLGKRFGKPIPYYEEIERDENEHVKALARLYYRTLVKGAKKNGQRKSRSH